LARVPYALKIALAIPYSKVHFTPASVAWWVSLAIAHEKDERIWDIFRFAHQSVRAVLILFQSMD
jgi:hypothetical protein